MQVIFRLVAMETECREWADGSFGMIHIYKHIKNSTILRNFENTFLRLKDYPLFEKYIFLKILFDSLRHTRTHTFNFARRRLLDFFFQFLKYENLHK